MLGLKNYGNNCYFNSIIQGISSSKHFCLSFRLFNSDDSKEETVNDDLKEFVNLKWSNPLEQTNFNTLKIHKKIIDYTKSFQVGRQEDSSELLTYLLDMIDETNVNHIKDLYKNKYSYTKMCSSCQKITKNTEVNNMMNVSIKEETKTLLDCIKAYIKVEIMDIFCEDCNQKNKFLRRIFLKDYVFPKVLFIQLKRYDSVRKNYQEIGFSSGMILNGIKYNLKAVIVHLGEMGSGHYITFGRFKDVWIQYDDNYCSFHKSDELPLSMLYQNGYIFIYDMDD